MNLKTKEILDDLNYCKNRKRGNINLNVKDCKIILEYIEKLEKQIIEYQKALDEITINKGIEGE